MDRKTKRHRMHHARYALHMPGRHFRYSLLVIAVAISGLLLMQNTRAASFVADSEIETGTVTANAAKTAIAGSSGGQAVTFGAGIEPVAKPYRFQAITGGNSIAVVWSASTSKIVNYEVFRNDAKIATVTPGSGTTGQERFGRTYIDKTVVAGTQYRYKIRAVAADGRMSSFTPVSTVTHPSSNNTAKAPNVVIDTSQGGAEHADFLRDSIKPHLETWYPKIADAVAYPDFTPFGTLTIIMDPNAAAAFARVWEGEIHVRPSFLTSLRQSYAADGMFLHEATHILEPYAPTYPANGPAPWATEGIADWVRDWFTLERVHLPRPNGALSQNYSEAGSMLQWGQDKYAPGLVHKVNVALTKNTYSTAFLTGLTGGRTADQLYNEMKAQYYGATGQVGGSGKCMDVLNSDPTAGAKLQLFDCNTTTAQRWTILHQDAGLHGNTKKIMSIVNSAVTPNGRCLDIVSSSTAEGARVHSWDCNFGEAQKWLRGSNNSLVNPNSGKCLSTTNGGTENGNQLIIKTCDGSASQRWTIPQ